MKKSLCESCSNKVRIKYHGKDIRTGMLDGECFYDFRVSVSDSRYKKHTNGAECHDTHVSYVIVDECSFYNKTLNRLKRKTETKVADDGDSDGDSNSTNGVTFTNIPGALLG